MVTIMFNLLAGIFFLCFATLAWINFRYAILGVIVLLPSYLIRLQFLGLPTTILELAWLAMVAVWLIKFFRKDWEKIKVFFRNNKILFVSLAVIFLSSLGAIVVSGYHHAVFMRGAYLALGQWRAYFFEPMVFFMILIGRLVKDKAKEEVDKDWLVISLVLSSISVAVMGLAQKFFPALYPPSLWNDVLNGRVTSFFTSPNAVGLFLVPIVPLVVYEIKKFWERKAEGIALLLFILLFLNLVTIYFSFSQGGWIALMVGAWVAVISFGYKKTALGLAVVGVIFAILFAPLREAVLFKDKGSQNRLRLWQVTEEYLTKSPSNFIFGTGIRRFHADIQKPIFEAKEMERIIYPHNIFLNFWTEIGFLGMLGIAGILVWGFFKIREARRKNLIWGTTIFVSLLVLVVHGLVDVPYFKNDLAFLFWTVLGLNIEE